jgi:hypothetical protein
LLRPAEGEQRRTRKRRGCNSNFCHTHLLHNLSPFSACTMKRRTSAGGAPCDRSMASRLSDATCNCTRYQSTMKSSAIQNPPVHKDNNNAPGEFIAPAPLCTSGPIRLRTARDAGRQRYQLWRPCVRSNQNGLQLPTVKAPTLTGHSGRTPADGSPGLTDGSSCHAHTVNPCHTHAAGKSDLRDQAVRLWNRRGCHRLRRCCNR